MSIYIREVIDNDINILVDLEKRIFGNDAWDKDELLFLMNENTSYDYTHYVVMEDEKVVIGYAGLSYDDYFGSIDTIGILSDCRKKGYGEMLLKYLIEYASQNILETLNLTVRVSNINAIRLYQKYGFEIKGTIANAYENEDGYYMEKEMIMLQ